jgi:hypothetical protein
LQRFTTSFLLIAAAVVTGLLLLEAGLRVAGVSYPYFYKLDVQRGHVLRPGVEGWYRNEGRAYVRINSNGLRDREHTFAKPHGTFRIAVLGDSFAEALQVPMERTFWGVLEKRLAGCASLAGRKVEVINFGVAGYGTTHELVTLRQEVWKYSPDLVLLAFFTGNDLMDNSRQLNGGPFEPYFVFQGDHLVLDDTYQRLLRGRNLAWHNFMTGLLNYSRVAQVVNRITRRKQRLADVLRHGTASGRPINADVGLGLSESAYRPPQDSDWETAWRITEGLLILARDEVRSHGAEFWITTLSTASQVDPDPAERQRLAKRLGIDSLFYPDLRIRALGSREHIPVVTLAMPMAEYAERHRIALHGFPGAYVNAGHWNESGHRLAGEILASSLCGRCYAEPPERRSPPEETASQTLADGLR